MISRATRRYLLTGLITAVVLSGIAFIYSQPTNAPDTSTPKKAVQAFEDALQRNDMSLAGSLALAEEQQLLSAKMRHELFCTLNGIAIAMSDKFGPEQGIEPAVDCATELAKLDEQLEGNKASVESKNSSSLFTPKFELERIGEAWKIDLRSDTSSAEDQAIRQGLLKRWNEIRQRVEKSGYKTKEEVAEAIVAALREGTAASSQHSPSSSSTNQVRNTSLSDAEELSEYMAAEARKHVGEKAIVTGRVLQVVDYPGTCITYLFGADSDSAGPLFLIRLKKDSTDPKVDVAPLMNRMVAVSGTIMGTRPPSIEVESSSQIVTERKYNLEELDAAITRAGQALAADPHDSNAYYRRGMALEKKAGLQQSPDSYRAAIDDYNQSIKLDASRAEALVRIGDCYAALQDYKAAQRAYDQAIDASPEGKELLKDSIAKEKMRACSAAIHVLQKLGAFEPNNASLYYRQATLHLMNQNSRDANANFKIAAELEPTNPKYANAAGHPVGPFKRQMTADEMMDVATKGVAVFGAALLAGAAMQDAKAAEEAKAQRERIQKIIAESGGRKMVCPICNGLGQIVYSMRNDGENPYRFGTTPYRTFEDLRVTTTSRKCDRCRGEGVIDK